MSCANIKKYMERRNLSIRIIVRKSMFGYKLKEIDLDKPSIHGQSSSITKRVLVTAK